MEQHGVQGIGVDGLDLHRLQAVSLDCLGAVVATCDTRGHLGSRGAKQALLASASSRHLVQQALYKAEASTEAVHRGY